MIEPKPFSFRMSQELKSAAEALTLTPFQIDRGGAKVYVRISSVNNALVFLMEYGREKTLAWIEAQIEPCKEKLMGWRDLTRFFLDHPDAEHAQVYNLLMNTAGYRLVSDTIGTDGKNYAEGIPKQMALDELAKGERHVIGLETMSAALRASVFDPALRPEHIRKMAESNTDRPSLAARLIRSLDDANIEAV